MLTCRWNMLEIKSGFAARQATEIVEGLERTLGVFALDQLSDPGPWLRLLLISNAEYLHAGNCQRPITLNLFWPSHCECRRFGRKSSPSFRYATLPRLFDLLPPSVTQLGKIVRRTKASSRSSDVR